MGLLEAIKVPLRAAKGRLRESLMEHTGYYTQHNVMDAAVGTGGEAFFVRLCAPGWKTVLDVGANHGDFARTVLAANPDCAVTCFEPNEALAAPLRAALSASPASRVVTAAVGDQDSTEISLYMNPSSDAHSSPYLQTTGSSLVHVPQISLDAHCARESLTSVDCVKIDTEGHEWAVMQGMRTLLDGTAGVVTFEYGIGSHAAKVSFRQIVDLLEPHYRICHILPGGLLPLSYRSRIEEFGFSNWAAFSRKIYG